MNGRWPLLNEYRLWLGPMPAYQTPSGPAPLSGYREEPGIMLMANRDVHVLQNA